MRSGDWRKRAAEYGKLAQKLPSLAAKQRLLVQQQKCLAQARLLEMREQAELAAAPVCVGVLPVVPETDAAARVPRPEPSDAVKASPFLMRLWEQGIVSPEELERRAHDVDLLKERLSATPYHASRFALDPDYWNKLYDSRVNW